MSGGPASADTVFIGVAASLAATSESYFRGVHQAVAELNARRDPGFPPFAVREPLEVQSTQVAVALALRDDPRVVGVVGHTGSAQTLEAAPIYGDAANGGANGIVAISPTATNPAVTRASAWVFRVCPTDLDGAKALGSYAADSLGARRAAIIYRNDLFGRGFVRAFAPVFERGGRTVVERDPYLAGITEYEAYAGRIAQRDIDVLVIAGGAGDAVEMIRAVRATGARPDILGTDDLAGLTVDPAAAQQFADVRYTAFFVAGSASSQVATQFVRRYRRAYEAVPDHRAALSYDAAMLIGIAAMDVGPDRRRVRDRVAQFGREEPAHAGVTGEIRFDDWGDAVQKPISVVSVAR